MRMEDVVLLLLSSFLLLFLSSAFYLYNLTWLRPERIRERLRRQGVRGPSPSFLYGNVLEMKRSHLGVAESSETAQEHSPHSHHRALFPWEENWKQQYGRNFVYSKGNIVVLNVGEPGLVRDLCLYSGMDLGKPSYLRRQQRALLGDGIVRANGDSWAKQRKIIAPEFFMDKIKGMVELMVSSAMELVKSWESRVESEGGSAEIAIDEDLKNLSAEIISKACFGSSHARGGEIASKLMTMLQCLEEKSSMAWLPDPLLRYLPTKLNTVLRRLDKETRSLILKAVEEREEESDTGKGLLQSLLDAVIAEDGDSNGVDDFIADNYKTLYVAGHWTTAITASWVLMLLASYPKWQSRVRAEVQQICGDDFPDADKLRGMKTLTMVIRETLRLYPPGIGLQKEALSDMTIGGVHIPKGLILAAPMLALHSDPEIWGPDVYRFNPERFANGVTGACKFPHAYMPFGYGPRVCLGQNLAMTELKIIVAVLVTRFEFCLSRNYRHSPTAALVLQPKYGVQLMVKKASHV